METLNVKLERQKGNPWYDSKGMAVEKKRIKKSEIMAENAVTTIVNKAVQISNSLHELKHFIEQEVTKVLEQHLIETGGKFNGLQAFTINKFDGQGKVALEVVPIIKYDEDKMKLASDKFDEFMEGLEESKQADFLKKIINDVFKKRRGGFDDKKISDILKHRDDIFVAENRNFQDACVYLLDAKVTTGVRTYPKIYYKNTEDKFEPIVMQFSQIQTNGESQETMEQAERADQANV